MQNEICKPGSDCPVVPPHHLNKKQRRTVVLRFPARLVLREQLKSVKYEGIRVIALILPPTWLDLGLWGKPNTIAFPRHGIGFGTEMSFDSCQSQIGFSNPIGSSILVFFINSSKNNQSWAALNIDRNNYSDDLPTLYKSKAFPRHPRPLLA